MPATKINPKTISEIELATYMTMEEKWRLMKKELNALEKSLTIESEGLIQKLKDGWAIEGNISAIVTVKEGSCRPEWKEVYLSHMENHYITRVQAEQEVKDATPIPSKEVLVVAPRADF